MAEASQIPVMSQSGPLVVHAPPVELEREPLVAGRARHRLAVRHHCRRGRRLAAAVVENLFRHQRDDDDGLLPVHSVSDVHGVGIWGLNHP